MNILKKSSYYILGESNDVNGSITVCAGEFFQENTDIFVLKDEVPPFNRCYWAVLVDNGRFSESWFSINKLSENDFRPYTFEEQKKQANFFSLKFGSGKYDDIIGYYKFEKDFFKSE